MRDEEIVRKKMVKFKKKMESSRDHAWRAKYETCYWVLLWVLGEDETLGKIEAGLCGPLTEP